MRRRASKWAAGVLVAAAIAGGGGAARAQNAEDKAAAEALFNEGQKLLLAKKYAEACPKLEASHKLDPGIGTLLYIADCYEGQGRFASAYGVFSEARDQARTAGQGERERIARGRAALLEPKLHKLTIVVSAPETPGLAVKRGESSVRKEVWGLGLPVDKGEWTITASAPGKKPWSAQVKIPEGPGAQSVTVPALEDAPAAAPKPPEATPTPPAATPPKPEEPPARDGGPQRVAGLVVGSAGVAGLILGGVFAGLAASSNATAKRACPQPEVLCADAVGVAASHRALRFADAATGLLIGGGAATATGFVVWIAAPRGKPQEKAWITPVVGGGVAGVSFGRTW